MCKFPKLCKAMWCFPKVRLFKRSSFMTATLFLDERKINHRSIINFWKYAMYTFKNYSFG